MTYSSTRSRSSTFTVVHARHIAAKLATDLKRLQRFYGKPSDNEIVDYEREAVELLKGGYLEEVYFGFRRHGKWIDPTLKYKARDLAGASGGDDDPGRIKPGRDISGASFYSFLIYSASWLLLPQSDKDKVERELPFKRGSAAAPGVNGYFDSDLTYSAGGRALNRASVRGFGDG